jgi:hypothetical protein
VECVRYHATKPETGAEGPGGAAFQTMTVTGNHSLLPVSSPSLSVRRRVLCWAIVLLLALMAVGWRSFGGTSSGTLRYFLPPMAVVIVLAQDRMIFLGRIRLIALSYVFFSVTYVAISAYNGVSPYGLIQAIYLFAAFSAGATLMTAAESEWAILRWAGPLAVLCFCYFFWSDAHSIGVNPITTFKVAIETNNRNLIEFNLFQAVFNARSASQGIFNSTALRAAVIAGMVVPMLYSAYACTIITKKGNAFRIAYWASWAIAGILVVLSLARALEVTVLLALLLPLARLFIRNRARLSTALTVVGVFALVALSVVTPVASLLWSRLTDDTTSYGNRFVALNEAFHSIGQSPLLGQNTGGDTTATLANSVNASSFSAHNFILDPTVFAGLFTGILAAVFVIQLFGYLYKGIGAYFRDPRLLWPVAAALYAPVAMFTNGSGSLQIPECMGMALFFGVMASDRGFIRPRGRVVTDAWPVGPARVNRVSRGSPAGSARERAPAVLASGPGG